MTTKRAPRSRPWCSRRCDSRVTRCATCAPRAALIAAATREFAERGLDASLDAICARAGLTRGAFYVHFSDREALIVAVMEHVLGGFVQLLTGAGVRPPSLDTAARMFFAAARAGAPVVRGGPGVRFHHLLEACQRSPRLGETYRRLVLGGRDRLAATIAAEQQAGSVRAQIAAPALADLFLVVVLGTIACLELELPVDVERLEATARALVLGTGRAAEAGVD